MVDNMMSTYAVSNNHFEEFILGWHVANIVNQCNYARSASAAVSGDYEITESSLHFQGGIPHGTLLIRKGNDTRFLQFNKKLNGLL